MLVEKIKDVSKTKSKIFLDTKETLTLYKSEIKNLKIKEGEDLNEETYARIMNEILPKRAISRCNYLLSKQEKTSGQIRESLFRSGYPTAIIEKTIEYLKEKGYINDRRYASNYVSYYKDKKGIEMIKVSLMKKGIKKEEIEEIIELELEGFENDQIKSIKRIVEKKCKNIENPTYEEKNKIKASIIRKGYKMNEVIECVDRYFNE